MNLLKKVDKINNILGAVALGIMLFASAFNIISAWTTGKRYGQVEELVLAAFVWVTYIGVGTLYSTDEHIKVDFIVNLLPPKAKKFMDIFRNVVTYICSVTVAYFVINLMIRAAKRGMATATLRISYVLIDLSVLLGFTYILVDLTTKLIKIILNHKNSSTREVEEK